MITPNPAVHHLDVFKKSEAKFVFKDANESLRPSLGQDLWLNHINLLVFACFTGRYQLPRIPGVPRASADLPHVVHRDCQLHRHRRRSLGLLSCVSALLI